MNWLDRFGSILPGGTMILAGVGLVALGLIAAAVALAVRPKGDGQEVLNHQIEVYGRQGTGAQPQQGPAAAGLAGQAQELAARALAGNQGFEDRLAVKLEGANVAMRPAEWLPLHGAIAFGIGLLGLLLTGGNFLGLVFGLLLGLLLPWAYLGRRESKRVSAFQNQLAETMQLMAGSLRAGLSLAQSVDTIVREGSEPMAGEFRRVVVETRLGVDLEDALQGVSERMRSKDFAWVVMAIRIQRNVGGNLAELLLRVADTLREREYIRRHVKALSAEGRLSVYVLGGLPPVFLAYLAATRWEYVGVLFTTPIGWVMLGVMTVLLCAGVLWMSKVSKVAF